MARAIRLAPFFTTTLYSANIKERLALSIRSFCLGNEASHSPIVCQTVGICIKRISGPFADFERSTAIDLTVGGSFATFSDASKSDVCRATREASGLSVIAT